MMHPLFAEELARQNMADQLAEAERARLAPRREATHRRWRQLLGYVSFVSAPATRLGSNALPRNCS